MSGVSTATEGNTAFLRLVLCVRAVALSSVAGAPVAAEIAILRGRPGRRFAVVAPAIHNSSHGSSFVCLCYMTQHTAVDG